MPAAPHLPNAITVPYTSRDEQRERWERPYQARRVGRQEVLAMITRIELDGFKTFQDFKLELAPLQVIVGGSGSGKSNLFDALRLLSRLADSNLRTAFQDLRGEAGELFTILPNSQSVNHMRLAVDLFVEPQVQDSWGDQANLKYTRLRYELRVERSTDDRGLERLYITHESLISISLHQDGHGGRKANVAERVERTMNSPADPRAPWPYHYRCI